jgi:hypothetical protein
MTLVFGVLGRGKDLHLCPENSGVPASITTSLTDSGLGAVVTTDFVVRYESTLANQARVVANANALIAVLGKRVRHDDQTAWMTSHTNAWAAEPRRPSRPSGRVALRVDPD